MNGIKYLIVVFGLAAGAASAQPPGPPPGGPGGPGGIERLAVLLDLDAYQKGEVERVLKEQREAMIAARPQRDSGERPSFEEMRTRREALEQETLTKLQSVLTEQQITKFKLLAEGPGRNGPRGPRGQGGRRPTDE
jgi:hypothetical protein